MTEAALARYYADQVTNERLMQGQAVFAQASLRALERLVAIPNVSNVLDVGAGYGFLLSYLQSRHGVRGTGVEPSEVESEFGRSRLHVDVRTSMLDGAGLEHETFDLVCAFEVLEHTLDPQSFIAELVEYVTPGGYLVIGTDNFESPVVKGLGSSFPKWIPHTHVSHFAPPTLRRLLTGQPGIEIAGYRSYTPWEFLARWALAGARTPAFGEETYRFKTELRREVDRPFKYYRLREKVTGPWFWLASRADLSQEMMFIAARKPGNK